MKYSVYLKILERQSIRNIRDEPVSNSSLGKSVFLKFTLSRCSQLIGLMEKKKTAFEGNLSQRSKFVILFWLGEKGVTGVR